MNDGMKLIGIIQILILINFFIVNGSYTLLTIIAFPLVRKQHKRADIDDYPFIFKSRLAPGVSLLLPAYNEEATIVDSVDSLLMSRYPLSEVIVINDGSEDDTLETLIRAFQLRRVFRLLRDDIRTEKIRGYYVSDKNNKLIVLDKENGGKADALNAGINAANFPYFFSIDADVILENDAIVRIITPIIKDPSHVIAAGGIVRVANGCVVKRGKVLRVGLSKKRLPVLQVVEYIRAFAAGRAGLSALNCLMIISGAFGLYSAAAVRHIGGYSTNTVGEDMELLVRLQKIFMSERRKFKVVYMAYPVCWTEVPENLRDLGRQRARWHRGLCETLWHHTRGMFLNLRYGHISYFALPFFFFVELLGPIGEFLGYVVLMVLIAMGHLDLNFFFLFLSIALLWGIFLSFSAILFEDVNFTWYRIWRSLLRLLPYALLENIGYRQLTVWWRLRGFMQFLGRRRSWGTLKRRGFSHS